MTMYVAITSALCAHCGVTQCRTYFKTGQPRHSLFDPLLTSTRSRMRSTFVLHCFDFDQSHSIAAGQRPRAALTVSCISPDQG